MDIRKPRNIKREQTCHGPWFKAATAWRKELDSPEKVAKACSRIFAQKITFGDVRPLFETMQPWQKDSLAMAILWLDRKPGRQGDFKQLFDLCIDRQYQWTSDYLNSRLIVRQRFIKILEETFPPLPPL